MRVWHPELLNRARRVQLYRRLANSGLWLAAGVLVLNDLLLTASTPADSECSPLGSANLSLFKPLLAAHAQSVDNGVARIFRPNCKVWLP